MKSSLHKLGRILYHIYTLKSEDIDINTYSKYCSEIYKALSEVAPRSKPKQINTDFIDIILETNRRLKDAR